MVNTLREIQNTKGVVGAFIVNKKSNVAASVGELEAIPLKSMAVELNNFFNDNSIVATHPEKLQFLFDNRIILIQVLEIGYVVVLCEVNAVTALLRLSLNVAFTKIKNNNKILNSIANA